MTVTDYARQQIVFLLGGSTTGSINYFLIGTGSSTVTVSDTTLQTAIDRQLITAVTFPAAKQIIWQGDWNSVEMSGIQLQEFGMIKSGTGLTGSIWSRALTDIITFDGTNELRIEETWDFF